WHPAIALLSITIEVNATHAHSAREDQQTFPRKAPAGAGEAARQPGAAEAGGVLMLCAEWSSCLATQNRTDPRMSETGTVTAEILSTVIAISASLPQASRKRASA